MLEVWKYVPGYEELYEVSSLGTVRSVDREIESLGKSGSTYLRPVKGRIITPIQTESGLRIELSKDGKQIRTFLHRLVAISFVENPNKHPHIRHKDGNKSNNSSDNLEWFTYEKPKNVSNYEKLIQYASIFVGKTHAKDLIHDLWLRHFENGKDILTDKMSKRLLFVIVRQEFINSFHKKNAKISKGSTEFDQEAEVISEKDSRVFVELSDYDPSVFLEYSEVESIISSNIQRIIDSYGKSDPRAANAVKYAPETIMKVYELVKQDCSVQEISNLLDVGEQSVRNYKKKIVEICKFLTPSNSSSR